MYATDDSFVSVQTVQPIPIFCNRVLWGSYVQTLDTVCVIEIRDSFFFSRHAQPPLGLWLRALQCEWINILLRTPSIWFWLDRNALRFSFCCKGNPENQAQCDCSFFYLLLVASLRFSLVYLCIQFACGSPSFLGKTNKSINRSVV